MNIEVFKEHFERYVSLTGDLILSNELLEKYRHFFLGYIIQHDKEIKSIWKNENISPIDITYQQLLDYYEETYPEDGYILFYDLLADWIFNHPNLNKEISECIDYIQD